MPTEQNRPGRVVRLPLAVGFVVLLSLASGPGIGSCAPPAPPTELEAIDAPDDSGKAIDLKWKASADDIPNRKPRLVEQYEILRKAADQKDFEIIGSRPYGTSAFADDDCQRGKEYSYQVAAIGPDGTRSQPAAAGPVIPKMQFFDRRRAWFGAILLIVCGAVTFFIEFAKRGGNLRIRKIAGLEAVDDAVGRATEMGRPCLFVPGIQDMNEVQTVAGITILARVAKKAAEYNATVEVPTSRSLVMTVARETVQSAFLAAGRPDAYNEDLIYYLTDEQFGYVAGVTGKMLREKPAACFYMGMFFAESLFLAETGNSIGAIQLAGTAEPSQLPFFVAACDYTLIGEEFFAASAYLSGEPHQLGSLKGQDVGKMIGAALLAAGCVLATLHQLFPNWLWGSTALSYLVDRILR